MLSKKKFKNKDRLIKGISKDNSLKISVVKATDVIKKAKDNHHLSLLNTVLLGRTLIGAMLMASELKGEERIRLRLEGDGPTQLIVAEANRVGEVRGYVQVPDAQLDYAENPEIGDGIGKGLLTVSKTLYNEAEPRHSSTNLVRGNITDDLAYYMVQSEQIPSAILLDVGIDEEGNVTEAGGLFVQRLPDAPEGKIDQLQEKLRSFPSIAEMLVDGEYIDDIMQKAMDPIPVKELDRQPVDFFCRCSRKRFMNALRMLSYEDLKDISDEGQELVCHFCNTRYHISKKEIEDMLQETKAKMN
ncbi:MAG TPA: Hsp33 family molecular chaperone HslO [Balneolaceae bacterium]|nr:Hsp33 family molecular chaperone HslO [Balneolaceae bacterium]